MTELCFANRQENQLLAAETSLKLMRSGGNAACLYFISCEDLVVLFYAAGPKKLLLASEPVYFCSFFRCRENSLEIVALFSHIHSSNRKDPESHLPKPRLMV